MGSAPVTSSKRGIIPLSMLLSTLGRMEECPPGVDTHTCVDTGHNTRTMYICPQPHIHTGIYEFHEARNPFCHVCCFILCPRESLKCKIHSTDTWRICMRHEVAVCTAMTHTCTHTYTHTFKHTLSHTLFSERQARTRVISFLSFLFGAGESNPKPCAFKASVLLLSCLHTPATNPVCYSVLNTQ